MVDVDSHGLKQQLASDIAVLCLLVLEAASWYSVQEARPGVSPARTETICRAASAN